MTRVMICISSAGWLAAPVRPHLPKWSWMSQSKMTNTSNRDNHDGAAQFLRDFVHWTPCTHVAERSRVGFRGMLATHFPLLLPEPPPNPTPSYPAHARERALGHARAHAAPCFFFFFLLRVLHSDPQESPRLSPPAAGVRADKPRACFECRGALLTLLSFVLGEAPVRAICDG